MIPTKDLVHKFSIWLKKQIFPFTFLKNHAPLYKGIYHTTTASYLFDTA